MRFYADTQARDLAPHVVLKVRPEGKLARPAEWSAFAPRPPVDLEPDAELLIGTTMARVLWVDGDAAALAVRGRVWIISHLRPSEVAGSAMSFLQGAGVQEWVVRGEIGVPEWVAPTSS